MLIVLQSSDHTHIDKQALDGRGEHIHIVEDRLSSGSFSFAVDEKLEGVFFSDTKGNKIEYLDFDGELRHLFRANLKSPVNMAVVDDTIYWTGQNSKSLYITNTHNTGKTKKLKIDLPKNLEKIFSGFELTAITPIKIIPHPCKENNGGCSHICVSNGPTTRSCFCPTGMTFDSSKNTSCVMASKCEFK